MSNAHAQKSVPVGPPITGLIILFASASAIYYDKWTFVALGMILLVVLALGTAFLNKNY